MHGMNDRNGDKKDFGVPMPIIPRRDAKAVARLHK